MLESLSLESFEPHVDSAFVLDPEGEKITLVLVEATPIDRQTPSPDGTTRRPFSLLFRAPPGIVTEQRIYPLGHPALGRLDLFLVPMQPDQEGTYLEAVFT